MKKRDVALVGCIASLIVLLLLLAVTVIAPSNGNSEGSLPIVWYPAIAIDSQDNLHVVWEDQRDKEKYAYEDEWGTYYLVETNIYYAKFDSNGQQLVEDKRLTSRGGERPSVEVDSQDNVWITYWVDGNHIMKLTSDGDEVLEKDLHDRTDLWVAITAGSDDNIYLSWDEYERGQRFRYFMSLDVDGNVQRAITNSSLVTPFPGFPIIVDDNAEYLYLGEEGATDSLGNVHEVWGCPGYDLYYSKVSSGGVIETNKTQITSSGRWSCFPSMMIDSSNDIHVIDEYRSEIGYLELDNAGGILRTLTNIRLGEIEASQLHPNLDVDSLGNVYIVWQVDEIIREHSHSGLRDYAYTVYCARIDDGSSGLSSSWIVASSENPGNGDWVLLIILALIGLIAFTLGALLLYPRAREDRGRERGHRIKR